MEFRETCAASTSLCFAIGHTYASQKLSLGAGWLSCISRCGALVPSSPEDGTLDYEGLEVGVLAPESRLSDSILTFLCSRSYRAHDSVAALDAHTPRSSGIKQYGITKLHLCRLMGPVADDQSWSPHDNQNVQLGQQHFILTYSSHLR